VELNRYILLVRVICEKYRFRGQSNVPHHYAKNTGFEVHATVLLAVKYSAELNKYEGYLRKIPVSRTVKCPSPLKRLGIAARNI
jgi:hypothetical protein